MEVLMTNGLRKSALALGLIGSAAFLPLPAYALDGDVEIEAPGMAVDVPPDRPGIVPGLFAEGPGVIIETPDDDDYADEEDDGDDAPPAAAVDD
jgi:hypothetical protein